MHSHRVRRSLWIAGLSWILCLALLACNGTLPGSETGEEPTQPPAAQPAQPTAAPEQPTATPEPLPEPLPELAGLDTLASYRLRIAWLVQNEEGSQSYQTTSSEERVRGASPAMRIVVIYPDPAAPAATLTNETVYVGTTAWVRQPDGSWMEFTAEGWEEQGGDFLDPGEIESWVLVGEETVQGIATRHYATAEGTTLPVETGEGTASLAVQGELWVANQPDLPPVIIRQRVQWTGPISPFPFAGNIDPGQTLITRLDAELAEVNTPLAVGPPQLTPTPEPTATSPPPTATFTPPPPPSPTFTPPPPPPPTATPDPNAPPAGFFEQPSYAGDCLNRPAGSVCLGFDDGYIWFISPFNDSVMSWGEAGTWQGKTIQVVFGQRAEYHHILGTNLIRKVDK